MRRCTVRATIILAALLLSGCAEDPEVDCIGAVLDYLAATGVGAEYVALGRELHAEGRLVVVPTRDMRDFLGYADREAGRVELAEELFVGYAMHERLLHVLLSPLDAAMKRLREQVAPPAWDVAFGAYKDAEELAVRRLTAALADDE